MIGIREFDNICKGWVHSIDGLEGHVLVAQDNHAVNALKDRVGVQLVAVIPSSNRDGRQNRGVDDNTTYLFIISKGWTGQTRDEELDQYETTQNIIISIREAIEEGNASGCGPFWRLQTSSFSVDPEFNIFGGWNGWSMLLTF